MGLPADVVLRDVADREPNTAQGVLAEHVQHVALVLRSIGAALEPEAAAGRGDDTGMMPGGHRVEPEQARPGEQAVELEMAVALDARVRRAAPLVVGDVGFDHMTVEVVGEVEHDVIDAELLRDPARRRRHR